MATLIIMSFLVLQSELFKTENVLKFADYLYNQEDYDAAVNEYRRYIFLSDSVADNIYERIVDCLVRLNRYNEAITESGRIQDVAKRDFKKGLIYFLKGEFDSSRGYLEQVGVPYKEDAKKIIGFSYAYQFRFEEASNYLELPEGSPSYKKTYLGGIFALFPGGGHFYTGRIGDGIYSFLVVTTSALLAYYYYNRDEDLKCSIALGATVLFYAGNIYGGINAVRNYNYYQNEKYLQRIIGEE